VDFFLNEKIKWHDGRDFTAADVEFTYRLLTDKNLSTPYLSNYLTIKSVETSGRYQIKIVYYKPFLNILRPWAVSILPKHILENESNLRESKFNRNPIGTGPYKMLQWVTGEYIILESNTNYHKGKPYFDKTVFKIIPDQSQQFLAMSNGQVDYMQFTFDQYKNYGQDPEFEKRFNIYRLPYQWGYLYVGYNNQKGALANKNIRKALGMGMNVDELAEGAYMGYATRVSGPYRHNTPAYNTDVKLLEFNPDKAKELIKNEGYKLNSNGYFEKDGKILEFSLKTNMDNKEREHMGRYITQYWKNIGVKCNLNLLDWTNFLKDMRNGDFDVVMLGWSLGITPDLYQTWHSDAIPWGGKSGLNYVGFSNSEVDELLEKIRFIPSLEHAYEYTWRVHEIIAEEQPYTFLFAEDYVIVMDKRIYGVNVTENKVLNDWLEWYVPKQLIKYKDGY
jgi:peptide/nickel transport system substrate-binding protein